MKKSLLYSMFFAVAALCSCSEDYDDWAKPQGFEQEDSVVMSLTVTPAASFDMADVAAETDSVSLFTATPNIPEGSEVTAYNLLINDSKTLAASFDGKVSKTELVDAVTALYGKRPVERTLSLVVCADVAKGSESFVVKSDTVTCGVTLVAPVISTAYYLVGDMAGWDAASMKAFTHSGKDVYDDPVFSIIFTTTADNQYWKIIPQSNVDGDFWGNPGVVGVAVDGDTSLEGTLINDGAQAGKIETAGMYKMTINMMDYTYTIQAINFGEAIYVAGDPNWAPATAPMLTCNNFDGVYTGFSYLNGKGFKFTKERNWEGGEYNYNDFVTYVGGVSAGDGTNLKVDTDGYYYIVADASTSTLTITPTTWHIIGSATAAVWDNTTAPLMTYNSADGSWEITTDLAAGELKFLTNYSWNVNLGGDVNDLTFNGGNITVEAGNYTIKLFTQRDTHSTYYCTLTKN